MTMTPYILSVALSLVPINTEIALNSRDENVHFSLQKALSTIFLSPACCLH